ncbi:MAG: phosphatase PAP2-related protein [Minisyncoccia bacterium]
MEQKDTFALKDLLGREHRYSLLGAFILLGFAYVAEHFANLYEAAYSARPTSTYVGDLLLDNLPTLNLNILIIDGALFSIMLGIILVLLKPRYFIFSLKALALFIAIRALFVSLTHVGIYPGNIGPDGIGMLDAVYTYLNFQTGFFFSGHTGLPFLMALIFWDERLPRCLLLLTSAVFGAAVLFAHIHYSIDVLAAPFMAFGIFEIAKYLFARDYELLKSTTLREHSRKEL